MLAGACGAIRPSLDERPRPTRRLHHRPQGWNQRRDQHPFLRGLIVAGDLGLCVHSQWPDEYFIHFAVRPNSQQTQHDNMLTPKNVESMRTLRRSDLLFARGASNGVLVESFKHLDPEILHDASCKVLSLCHTFSAWRACSPIPSRRGQSEQQ